jgi:hypothetical protein
MDICDSDFSWTWSNRGVWEAVDSAAGSTMAVEAAGLQWLLPLVWVGSAAFACAATMLLVAGSGCGENARLQQPKMKTFCGTLSLVAAFGSALVVLYLLLLSDIFNTGEDTNS